jgi:hypothetical protein
MPHIMVRRVSDLEDWPCEACDERAASLRLQCDKGPIFFCTVCTEQIASALLERSGSTMRLETPS